MSKFNPVRKWAREFSNKYDEQDRQQAEIEGAKQKALSKRAALSLSTEPNIMQAFNAAYTPQDWLTSYGYANQGSSFRHPSSESGNYSATVKADNNGIWRVNTLSTSDPLYTAQGAHDAFSVFMVLFHSGDKDAAMKDAGDNLLTIGGVSYNKAVQIEWAKKNKTKQDDIDYSTKPPELEKVIPASTFNPTLDNEHKYCTVDLLRKIDDNHILKRLCNQVAEETNLPVNSVFLVALAVFASMTCRKYAVQYQNGRTLPICLYVAVEQPSGTGKSWGLGAFQSPFYKIQTALLKAVQSKIKATEKRIEGGESLTDIEQDEHKELADKRKRLDSGLFVTNSTPEGLETTLTKTKGFFSAVSSEQGLFNSLLGNSYGSDKKANNNDIMLNGFDGGHVNSIRVSRDGYNGNVIGGIACFAQQGSIDNVFQSSNGTGISERFLMLAEYHSLGKRDHTKQANHDRCLVEDYEKACEIVTSVIDEPLDMDNLNNLIISTDAFLSINLYRNKIEPDLIDGGKFSHVSLRGAASKINMQIMKIAANLHLIQEGDYQPNIEDKYVEAAIDIANELLEANLKLCKDKGIMGVKAEFTSILSLFENVQRPRTERNIIQSKSQKVPFKDFSGSKTKLIKETLVEMVKQRLLTVVSVGGVTSYAPSQ